jgi:hypothetical protein
LKKLTGETNHPVTFRTMWKNAQRPLAELENLGTTNPAPIKKMLVDAAFILHRIYAV